MAATPQVPSKSPLWPPPQVSPRGYSETHEILERNGMAKAAGVAGGGGGRAAATGSCLLWAAEQAPCWLGGSSGSWCLSYASSRTFRLIPAPLLGVSSPHQWSLWCIPPPHHSKEDRREIPFRRGTSNNLFRWEVGAGLA